MTKKIILMGLSLALLAAAALSPAAAAAGEGMFAFFSITDSDGNTTAYQIVPGTERYQILLAGEADLTISVTAASPDITVRVPGKSAMGTLVLYRSISRTTNIAVSACTDEAVDTITLIFTLQPPLDDGSPTLPGDTDTPSPLPGGNDIPDEDAGDESKEPVPPPGKTQEESETDIILQIDNPTAVINSREYRLDAAPFLLSPGYTYVPLRFIAEAFGARVGWDGKERRVDVALDDTAFSLYIDRIIPGTGAAARIVNSRTFVPVRYVSETLGARVLWQPIGQTVIITKKASA
ncbi:MAG: copper amine oxidase N-terminal domain-containing protein [Firmicutes bacterium]|nr:copper amine oxidase N-terminal domain-containing protein [Bacillota bacterium]